MAVPATGWDRVLGMARPVLARSSAAYINGERVHRLADLVAPEAEGPEDLIPQDGPNEVPRLLGPGGHRPPGEDHRPDGVGRLRRPHPCDDAATAVYP